MKLFSPPFLLYVLMIWFLIQIGFQPTKYQIFSFHLISFESKSSAILWLLLKKIIIGKVYYFLRLLEANQDDSLQIYFVSFKWMLVNKIWVDLQAIRITALWAISTTTSWNFSHFSPCKTGGKKTGGDFNLS